MLNHERDVVVAERDVVVAERDVVVAEVDVERYVGYVPCIILLTSWAIRQLNSGHEATLIPIKKQNLTQGVRKNLFFVGFSLF